MIFTKQRFSIGKSRDGFLRPSADAYEFGRKSPPRMRAKSIDDLRWPYKISPLQAYLFGVITVWALYILYQFIIFAIYSARRRIKKGKKTSSNRTSRSRRLVREGDSLQTSHSFRPCAPMAKIPISPVYQPSKFSKARVHRKLSKKILDRTASRQRRKSRRQLRSMRAKKAATLLPTSPTYELFQHMNSHPLMETGGVNEASDIVTHESKHSFVTTSTREIPPHDNQRSKLGNAMDNFVGEEGRMTVDSSLDNNVGGQQVVSCGSSDSGKNIENRSTIHGDEMGEGKDIHSDCTAIDISSIKGENNNTAEKYWDQEILFVDAEKPLDQEIDKENIKNFSQKESSITKRRFLTVLVSNGIYDYTQKAQQREVLDLLTDLEIPHMTLDGMDQLQREKRDYFFGVSGVRGNYPQIFSSYEGNHTYLGGYDWMQSITFDELRKIVA